MKDLSSQKGFSIIEIIIAAVIISTVSLVIILSIQLYADISRKNQNNIQTGLLFEETAEVLQFLRDKSWTDNIETLETGTPYYLNWDGVEYTATTSQNFVNNSYERFFILESIERNSSDQISSSGTSDENTLLANISVASYGKDGSETLTTQTLIHNAYDN